MSEDKKRITVTLSKENISWLDANYNNRSGYINDLLDNAREGGGNVDSAIRAYQIENLQSDIAGKKAQLEAKKSRLETLKSQQRSEMAEQEQTIQDAKEALDGTCLSPDNPAVKHWAGEAGITPEELIEEIQ